MVVAPGAEGAEVDLQLQLAMGQQHTVRRADPEGRRFLPQLLCHGRFADASDARAVRRASAERRAPRRACVVGEGGGKRLGSRLSLLVIESEDKLDGNVGRVVDGARAPLLQAERDRRKVELAHLAPERGTGQARLGVGWVGQRGVKLPKSAVMAR